MGKESKATSQTQLFLGNNLPPCGFTPSLFTYLYDEDFPDLPSRKWKTFEIVIGMKNSVIGVEPDEGEL